MQEERKEKVEELKKDEDVKRALQQTASDTEAKPPVVKKRGFWRYIYLAVFVLAGAVYWTFHLGYGERYLGPFAEAVERGLLGITGVALALLSLRLIKIFLISRLANRSAQYNLARIADLVGGVLIILIILSLIFANWYTAVVSFGVISVIVGLALQTVISSFFGWIYILVKVPYKVGDRIKIGEASGDVIDVSYLDTTLWEFGGSLVSTDHPSGRVIKFPNSKVFSSSVYNYSWPLFPYVWNDIKFQIAYQSDLAFVAKTMSDTAAEEVGEAMMERIRTFRELLSQTPVDQLEVREYPTVVFRVSENTWIEAICRYLVEPRNAGRVKSRMIKTMLERLNAEPGKVMFPKGDNR